MVRINVHEAKAKLSHYLHLVQNGEVIIIMKRNTPVGEIHPPRIRKKRELGLARRRYPNWKPDLSAFNEPLSAEEISLWEDGPIFPEEK